MQSADKDQQEISAGAWKPHARCRCKLLLITTVQSCNAMDFLEFTGCLQVWKTWKTWKSQAIL